MTKRRTLLALFALVFSFAVMGADFNCSFNGDDDCHFFCNE